MRHIASIVFVMFAVVSAALAQTGKKETIAFYLTSGKYENAVYKFTSDALDPAVAKPLAGFLTMSIVGGGKYIAVERTTQVLKMIEAEQKYQRSGAVDDAQIAALGREWKAKYVFDVNVAKSPSEDKYILIVKIADIGSGKVIKKETLASRLKSDNDIMVAAQEITGWLEVAEAFHTVVGPGGMEMVFVKGGTFTMGCTKEQEHCEAEREAPAFRATVGDFYIGKFVVTRFLWRMLVPDHLPAGIDPEMVYEGKDLPITGFTWDQMMMFIERVNLMTGGKATYRLPTEAEWEYAARGGQASNGYIYAGGNDLGEVAWHNRAKGNKGPNPVGLKKPNEIGLYDMSGNVWEWVSDWYAPYTAEPKTNPQGGAKSRKGRVTRGGSAGEAHNCRIPARGNDLGNIIARDGSDGTGFRLVMTPNK